MFLPVCVRLRLCASFLVRLLFLCMCTAGTFLPGRPDVFPGRAHVPLGGLPVHGQRFHSVQGSGSHSAFNFVYLRGGSREFRWHLESCVPRTNFCPCAKSCGFPAGRTFYGLSNHPFTPALVVCSYDDSVFFPIERRASPRFPRNLGLSTARAHPLGAQAFLTPVTRWGRKFQDHPAGVDSPAWRLMEQLQDHPLGSTRPLAFNVRTTPQMTRFRDVQHAIIMA